MRKSEIYRIISNYIRMALGFLVGIYVVRGILQMGQPEYALYAILVVGFGLGVMGRELIRMAIIRHLIMDPNSGGVDRTSRSSLAQLCWLIGSFVFVLLSIVAIMPQLVAVEALPDETITVFAFSRAVFSLVFVLNTFNILVLQVQGMHVAANILLTAERGLDLLGLLLVVQFLQAGIVQYGVVVAGIALCLFFMVSALLGAGDLFRLQNIFMSYLSCRRVAVGLRSGLAVIFSFNSYYRIGLLLIGLVADASQVVVYGLAVQLSSMLRQLSAGVVQGLDTVVKRTASNGVDGRWLMVNQAAILQSIVLFGALLLYFACGDLFISWWLGDGVSVAEADLLFVVAGILLFGILFRAVSESWMSALNATVGPQSYAYTIALVSALYFPLAYVISMLTDFQTVYVYAVLFLIFQFFSHLIIVARAYAKQESRTYYELYGGICVPFLLSSMLIVSAELLGVMGRQFSLSGMVMTVAVYLVLSALYFCWYLLWRRRTVE